MYICEFCNKEFQKVQSLSAHMRHCKSNPNFDEQKYYSIIRDAAKQSGETLHNIYEKSKQTYTLTCKKCSKSYNLVLTPSQYNKDKYSHYCSISCRNSHKLTDESKQKIAKSLTKYYKNPEHREHLSIKNAHIYQCICCGKTYPVYMTWKNRKYCCQECKDRYWNEVYRPKIGGYRKGSGRGKSGWYKGIYCDSSWELAFVIYHMDHNLHIERCKEKRQYIFDEKTHIYYPDFITDNGIVEIKGYSTEQWKAKIAQNPDITVLYKKEMQPYIDYVVHKYGKDYISLYDGSNPSIDISNNQQVWMHRYDDINKTYYTKVINPEEYDEHIEEGWIRGRGKLLDGYTKQNIKRKNGSVFHRI